MCKTFLLSRTISPNKFDHANRIKLGIQGNENVIILNVRDGYQGFKLIVAQLQH